MGGLSSEPIPNPHVPQTEAPLSEVVDKSPFQFAAKWLEINENLNRARVIRHFLALKPRMSERISNTICMYGRRAA